MKATYLVITALIFAAIGALGAYSITYAFGYREVHLPDCSTPEPLVLKSFLGPAHLDAFVWGGGPQPIQLSVRQGPQVVEVVELQPGKNGWMSWDYHGDWYDDLILEVKGDECRLTVTYRL